MSPADSSQTPDALPDELQQLRSLLTPEVERVPRLEREVRRLKDVKVDLGLQLPAAVKEAASRDNQLAEALAPTLNNAFRESIRRDPQAMVDAISPIMGPAIRTSIRQALSSMMDSFNAALEHSLSLQGLQWRIEAWRTGKTFGEVALMRSLNYRVVQALLIHRETGLLLQQASTDGAMARDADLFSGMLTAVQDLMNDAVHRESYQSLDAVSIGSKPVWVESGPRAVLAVVIEGQPKSVLRENMKQILEQIHVEFANELSDFDGDAAPLSPAHGLLQRCLQADYKKGRNPLQRRPPALWKRLSAAVVLMGLLTFLGWWIGASWQHATLRTALQPPPGVGFRLVQGEVRLFGAARDSWIQRARQQLEDLPGGWRWNDKELTNLDQAWVDYVDLLRDAPGYVVVDSWRDGGQYHLRGLRDPLSAEPASFLIGSVLRPEDLDLQFQQFQSEDFLNERAKDLLEPPETIKLEVNNGVLWVRGSAPRKWIEKAQLVAPSLAGVRDTNFSELSASDQALYDLVEDLEQADGLTVLRWRIDDNQLHLTGWRDAGAIDPDVLLANSKASRENVHWTWTTAPKTP